MNRKKDDQTVNLNIPKNRKVGKQPQTRDWLCRVGDVSSIKQKQLTKNMHRPPLPFPERWM